MREEKGNGNREFSARGALSVNWDLSFFKNHLEIGIPFSSENVNVDRADVSLTWAKIRRRCACARASRFIIV